MSYSPIRIVDPQTDHLIKVKAGQDITVHLTNGLGNCELDVVSDYLKIHDKQIMKDRVVWRIVQKHDLSSWTSQNKTHLGDIAILFEKKNEKDVSDDYACSTLSVVLEPNSQVKDNNTLTVVNPKVSQIRVSPDEMLEVVCSDDNSFEEGNWKYDVVTPGFGIGFAYLEISDPAYDTKVYRRTFDPKCREYHFWFKFNEAAQRRIEAITEDGEYSAGNLEFFQQRQGEKIAKYAIELIVKIKGSKKKKRDIVIAKHIPQNWEDQGWEGYRDEYEQYVGIKNHHTITKYEPPPNRKSISLIEKENVRLDSDCKFMYMKW